MPHSPYKSSLPSRTNTKIMMSTLNNQLFDLSEQICYVQCGFCSTILLVSVPCSSMSMVVTVRCGHCTSLLSVNTMEVSFVPFHLLSSLTQISNFHEEKEVVVSEEDQDAGKAKDVQSSLSSMVTSSDNEEDDKQPVNNVVNKPPEKRQRAPSAYNRFIREEIRRLKAENPNLAHKEAFSTAAKNWAHFPPVLQYEQGDSCVNESSCHKALVNVEGNGFHEEQTPKHSMFVNRDRLY